LERHLNWFYQMKDLWETMGPVRFIAFFGGLTACIVGLVIVHHWLAAKINWPEAYGFRCSGRGCLWIELGHSAALLRGASFYEVLLFLWLWLIPGSGALTAIVIVVRRRWKRFRNRIRPIRRPR
jgi:hypothetical protein